jgi:cell division protein FtsB
MELNRKGIQKLAVPVLFALIAAWLAFGERGLIHLYRMEGQRERYRDRIQELERKNHELLLEIERLRTDEEYIESVARKELNLLKEDETHFHFAEELRSGVTNGVPSPGSPESERSEASGAEAGAQGGPSN